MLGAFHKERDGGGNTVRRLLYYLPRVITALIIALLYLVPIAESLTRGADLRGDLVYVLQATPVTLIAILAWKKPKIGGFVFTAIGLLLVAMMVRSSRGIEWLALIVLGIPILSAGILFLIEGLSNGGWERPKAQEMSNNDFSKKEKSPPRAGLLS